MRGQTKIAVAVGAGLIVAGIWYFGDKGPGQTASIQDTSEDTSPNENPGTDSSVPSVARRDDDRPSGVTPRPIADRGVTSTDTASPSPRRIEDSSGWGPVGDASRPRPVETHEPVTAMTSTDLPGERTGLSGVTPNLGPPSLDDVPPTVSYDLPPNTDKDAKPALPVLPPIEAVAIAGPEKADSTKADLTPAGTSPTSPAKLDSAKLDAKPVTKLDTKLDSAKNATSENAIAVKPAEKAKPKEHVVKAGETFSSIALKEMGSVKHVKELMKANPGKDPKKLFVGAKLIIPELPGASGSTAGKTDTAGSKAVAGATAPDKTSGTQSRKEAFVVPPPDPNRSYTVQPGEGWFEVARKFLGKGENYPELYEYNKERVGGDPHLLRAGTVIELPPSAKLPARSAPQPAAAQPTALPAK